MVFVNHVVYHCHVAEAQLRVQGYSTSIDQHCNMIEMLNCQWHVCHCCMNIIATLLKSYIAPESRNA